MKKESIFKILALTLITTFVLTACSAKEEKPNVEGQTETKTDVSAEIQEIDFSAGATEVVSTYDLLLTDSAYAPYISLSLGMNKDEVDSILGVEGIEREKDSFDPSAERYTYIIDSTEIWLSFKDSLLSKRAIQDSTDWSVAISKEDFAKITEGMEYEEVKNIIGEGQLISEEKGKSSYFWNVKTASQNVRIMFRDNKVSFVSGLNMK